MSKRPFSILALIAYCVIIIKVMVFKDVPMVRVGQVMLNFGGTNGGHPANFIPFRTILPYLLGDKGLIIGGLNLAGNIALLVPVGFFVMLIWRNVTWKKVLALGILAGLAIEVLQVVLGVGIFDIDDVMLNALGVMIGFWIYVILAKWIRLKKYKTILIAAVLVVAVMASVTYLVYRDIGQSRNMNAGAGAFENREGTSSPGSDPCGSTRGTGKITAIEGGTIALKRNDGHIENIDLTDRTAIKNSKGPVSASELKIGDRVTVVIMGEARVAAAVLVCGVLD